jgi:hypothetical protein
MLPTVAEETVAEEISNSVEKDGISFIFETRSLSAVVRYVYTPIEGNLSDIEVEINNSEAIKFAEGGGITIEMGGKIWSADDEEVERHFVSCELVGDCIEARWHWKHGEGLADFLYRIRIHQKSLIVELEGGNGKATGVDLGYVSGAVHPRVIQVPYFSFGDESPLLLATSGAFVSSMLDWTETSAAELYAPPAHDSSHEIRLGGGCRYHPASDGRRRALRERWILTVSRQFEEVLPTIPVGQRPSGSAELDDLLWYQVPALPPSEEAYVDVYEQLRSFKQWGLEQLLVNHPADVWEDGLGTSLSGAEAKGGDDALLEYLEAVEDLGYRYTLPSGYTEVSSETEGWDKSKAGLGSDGNPIARGGNRYLLKPSTANDTAKTHLPTLFQRFEGAGAFINGHAATPPSSRIDFDPDSPDSASFSKSLDLERHLLEVLQEIAGNSSRLIVGEGGSHWMYAGLLSGYLAGLSGPNPHRIPLLLDFDLKLLHGAHVNAGVGATGRFFGKHEPPVGERTSRSPWLDRYIATTVAYGHAGVLPEIEDWGFAAAMKTYYLLLKLQSRYMKTEVQSVLYHRDGSLLEVAEAVVSGVYEDSQVEVLYRNGLRVCVNGSWSNDWIVEHETREYRLPPASFLAHSPDGLLVYSADAGKGRMDYADCGDYFYCDTRGERTSLGPVSLSGAAAVKTEAWQIDVYPIECEGDIEIRPGNLWPDRRMPRLRILAFQEDEDHPQVIAANVSAESVSLEPREGICKFRITLPEWMVEPGK